MQYKAAGSLSRLAFDQKCVFITKFERAEVGLVVLALEQAGLVTRQEAPALGRHGDRRDLGARSWNTATIIFGPGIGIESDLHLSHYHNSLLSSSGF